MTSDPQAPRKRLSGQVESVNPVVPVHVWRTPERFDTPVMVVAHLEVYASIHEQAVEALPNETGGFLLGRVGQDVAGSGWIVEIDELMPIAPQLQHPAQLRFDWREVDRVRTYRDEHRKALVGWYHTHPDFGVFLSETDLERTHRVLFAEPFQVALVYDPIRGRAGYFAWEAPQRLDASQAAWREFGILMEGSAAPAPAAGDASGPAGSPGDAR